jgi:uncharacterized protein YsxB (DUF464 family)
MIKIAFNPNEFEIRVKGHAGYGKKGEDIVCAAVSALFYTLGETLHESQYMLEEPLTFRDEDGSGIVSCKPKPEYIGNVGCFYRAIVIGFETISKNYDKFVKFSLVKGKTKKAKT